MGWDMVEGKWTQVKGQVKTQWGKLTDEEIDGIAGNREQLVGKIQESYGLSRDNAEREVNDWYYRSKFD